MIEFSPEDMDLLARAAGKDAGNRNMRKGRRKIWSLEDYNFSVREYNRIMGYRNEEKK
jgi:hypothetical protein